MLFLTILAQAEFPYNFGRQGLIAYVLGPMVLGVLIYIAALGLRRPEWRWICMAPLVIGAALGAVSINRMLTDPLYRAYWDITTNQTILHWGMLIAPILAAGGLFAYDMVSRRNLESQF